MKRFFLLAAVLFLPLCLMGQRSIVSKPTGTVKGYGYVDLGLSVKWATHNIGAETPEEFGDSFAWGEIRTKNEYEWDTYKFSIIWDPRFIPNFSKYHIEYPKGRHLPSELLRLETILDPVDDAAHENWGGSWRMPTHDEWMELKEQCIWLWTSIHGHAGYKIISKKNLRSIFLPASGVIYSTYNDKHNDFGVSGYYWSSSIGVINTILPDQASALFFREDYISDIGYRRSMGLSIRPVTL